MAKEGKKTKVFTVVSAIEAGKEISISVSVHTWKDEAAFLKIVLFLIGEILLYFQN